MARRRGIALIIVLAIVAILSVLVLEFSYSVWVDVYLSSNYDARTQALYAAKAGVEYAFYMLRSDDNVRVHWLGEPWAQPMELSIGQLVPPRDPDEDEDDYQDRIQRMGARCTAPRDGGTAKVLIVDEERKIPLRMLVSGSVRGQQFCSGALERLIEGLNVPGATFTASEIVEQMVDWCDSDEDGSWEFVYQTLPDPYLARNRPFDTVDELRLLPDVTDELLYGTVPYPEVEPGFEMDEQTNWWESETTLEPGQSYGLINFVHVMSSNWVNVNTAPREVLVAWFGDNGLVADEIMERRREEPFTIAGQVRAVITDVAPGDRDAEAALTWTRLDSQWFRITSVGEYRGVKVKVTAIVRWNKRDITVQYYRIENVE